MRWKLQMLQEAGHVFSIKIVKKVKCHFPCFFIVVTFLIDLAFINFYIYFIFILLYNEFSFLHIYVIIIKYLNIYSKYKWITTINISRNLDIARRLTDIQEYPLDIYAARSKVGRTLREISSCTRRCVLDFKCQASKRGRTSISETFPASSRAATAQTNSASSFGKRARGGKSKKNEEKIEKDSDPLTILVDVSLSLSLSLSLLLFSLGASRS